MFTSLRARLWLTYALVIGVVISIVGAAFLFYLVRNPSEARLEVQRLRLVGRLVIQRSTVLDLSPARLERDAPGERLRQALERGDAALDARLAVFSPDGVLLGDTRATSASPLPSLEILKQERKVGLPTYRDDQGRSWLYSLQKLEGGAFLLVASPQPRPTLRSIWRDEFLPPVLRAGGVALLLALLLAYAMARWVSAPLDHMAQAARGVAEGKYQPLPLAGPQEVQTLGRAFNEMAVRVQSTQQAQRDFVANISHDLKTPLTSIQGFSQALLDGAADTPQAQQQAAAVIYAEAGRMHRLVLDLLDLARLEAGIAALEQHPVDLGQLLRAVVERFALQAEAAGVQLSLAMQEPLPSITGDPDRLLQVFANLLDNALRFTPPGGEVRVQAYLVDTPPRLEVQVQDTGPGIPPADLERIFERFYQVDKSRVARGAGAIPSVDAPTPAGTGLGLAIVRQILQAHGGTIAAHNQTDTGSGSTGAVFVVQIPVTHTQQTA